MTPDQRAGHGQRVDEAAARTLLAHLGAALVGAGQPVHEVEDDVAEVSTALGFPDLQIAAAPTGVTLSLFVGSPSTFVANPGSLRLDQASDVREIRHLLVRGRLDAATAQAKLLALRDQPPPFDVAGQHRLGHLLHGHRAHPAANVVERGHRDRRGLAVVALVRLTQRFTRMAALLPVLAAFVVACLVFVAARQGWVEAPLRTLLAPLAVLLPGALLVTAMAELVAGHMVAGTSRLGYGLVQVLLFTLGIAAAAKLFPLDATQLGNVRIDQIGWYAAPLGLVLVTLAIGWLESPPLRLLPWIFVVLLAAFFAQVLGQHLGGAVGGAFLGAMVATLGSYSVELVVPRLARLVVFLPSFWLLVPGSLGVLAATQVAVDPEAHADVLGVVAIVAALALGLLLGSAIAQAIGGLLRKQHARRPSRRSGS